MQYRFEILKEGDKVLNVFDNHVAVLKKTGDVEIFHFYQGSDFKPRLSPDTILITRSM